jgi:hypothetical protein
VIELKTSIKPTTFADQTTKLATTTTKLTDEGRQVMAKAHVAFGKVS